MTNLIVGNVVATIAAMFMIYAGILKDKKKILFVQTIQIALLVASNFILGGVIGGILNILCVIRNILSYNDKLDTKSKILITILSIGLSIPFNDKGILGLLPTVSTVLFIWLMNTKDVIKFKWLVIFTNFTWLVYDILILSVVTAVFDFLCIVTNWVTILSIKKDRRKEEKLKEEKMKEEKREEMAKKTKEEIIEKMETDKIEKEVQRKIENVLNDVDSETEKKNTKTIKVDLDRKFDLLRTYNDKKVDLDLIEYLIDQIGLYKEHEKVKIVLNKRCELDVNAIKLIKEGLKEEYKKSINVRDQNNLKQLWLLTMGIALLFLSTKVQDDTLWKEVLVIIGWVPIWEMMEVELFPDAAERKRRQAIKRLLKCEIVEKTMVAEKVESIEISKVEDDIK